MSTALATEIGFPLSLLSAAANRSKLASIKLAIFSKMALLFSMEVSDQGMNAF